MLRERRTSNPSAPTPRRKPSRTGKEGGLTRRDDHPRQVEAKVVHPEVQRLGAAVGHAAEVLLGGAGGVVEEHAVEVAHADHHLHGVAERAVARDAEGRAEAEGPPDELSGLVVVARKRAEEGGWDSPP